MEPGIYVSLSGQLALQRRLDTIANNVANSSTPGFRAENVTFESLLSRQNISYSGSGSATFARNSGSVTKTDNPFDVALSGEAFLAINLAGGTAYTRDGRLSVNDAGDLVTIEGNAVLDAGGSPIQINPARGPVQIARNGTISQGGDRVGALGLFSLPRDAVLTRGPGASVLSDRPGEPVSDFTKGGVVHGHIESSNVSPVLEMTRLISVTRAFESLAAAVDQSDKKLSEAIRTLGSGGK